MTAQLKPHFPSVNDIRRANAANGGHWFSRDTLRFFGTRFGQTIYGGRFFVTSELFPSGTRLYSVREADADGSVSTVGEFGAYTTQAQAISAARREARKDEDPVEI